ncbi:hypothetical protein N7U66_17710 [Lacinutrix neustonica]|uniref:DUF4157 domain-containing protein n=1 Tax=Lacinutrix neustonica TaxID=2980107 RepID=A0A9E8SD49_9FLAO|nr:hypothetical protein [Lacinutrix neustonica]WAC01716.1 hypothetical protein N7U66_17710 [Lacinutrix neustonica]
MILFSKYLVPKGYVGITIFPFVVLKHHALKGNRVLVNHEKIHLKQQIELLVILFYVFYGIEFMVRLIKYKNWNMAYKNISFEREAYTNENNLEYLNTRTFWMFFSYI